ncbi:MAG: bifunctional hydroxymethylpyrimidine kinase/phosphomethylpyrimidine kinase [Rhizobiales bacterium]|nr:bifunctional hydroxymethylpyrimidine kinase/phosphomethylpyrimidine kinase [Hyphomicrobiales bacterium]
MISYFLSAIGDDIHGQLVVEQSKQAGIDLSHCQIVKDGQTASYLSIVNGDGEMQTAINDMAIIDKINVNYLQSIKRLINEAELIIFDTNLTQDAIDYICQNFSHIPIYVDTVSGVKASKIEHNLNYLNCIMPNLNEAEILSGIHAKNDGDLSKIATYFHEKGLQNIYITRGKQGAYFSGMSNGEIHTEHLPALSGDIINANGAGDAFMAGLAAAQLSKMSLTNTLIFARACAFIAAKSEHTINPEMSQALVAEYMENNNE